MRHFLGTMASAVVFVSAVVLAWSGFVDRVF